MLTSRADRLIADCNSWDDLWERLVDKQVRANTKTVGDVFERLTQVYLLTKPEYRSKLQQVWRVHRELPENVRRRLGIPLQDVGIDLVAKTRHGKYWTIQCKFRGRADTPLTYEELSTFSHLSFVTCRGIALALVVHTTSKPIRKRKLLKNTAEIGLDRWLALTKDEWEQIRALCRNRKVPIQPRTPKPHQQKAVAAAKVHFMSDRQARGRLIMPCGTGKSLTAFWIAEALKPKSILVAVPSLALIRQSLADWTREFLARGIVPDWFCVCSDESTSKFDQDEFVSETYDLGIPATTDRKEIATFLKRPANGHKIVFTTYQSSPRLAKAARAARHRFDLAILDEAHKTVGVKGKTFATLLFDRNIPIRKRLFMTATERVLKGKSDEVLSMDDEAIYGGQFFLMTFKEAIAQKVISDYRILTVTVSDRHIRDLIQDNRLLDISKRDDPFEAQSLAAGVALKRVFGGHAVKHAISFHRSIRSADGFRKQQDALNCLRKVGPRSVNLHISSKRTAGERAQLMKNFVAHRRALMTNARCLTEGVDIPAIDCVLFADPKQSTVDIVQAAGRAMRRHRGKKYGYILLPLTVPDGIDLSKFAETTEFRQVARTITALSTQDERIADQFRIVRHGRKRSGKIVEIEGDVPVGLKLDADSFADAISTKVWERVGRVNWRPFEEARTRVRKLDLKNVAEWRNFTKAKRLAPDVPANPHVVYKDHGWKSFGDWLGTENVSNRLREFRSFDKARAFVRTFGLKSNAQWREFAKSDRLPGDIPTNPSTTYRNKGWMGFGDWLGTGQVSNRLRRFKPFKTARKFTRSLNLKSSAEWLAFTKSGHLPKDIPVGPQRIYKNEGWAGMGDWLGTGTTATHLRRYRAFNKARAFARSLDLKSSAEWFAFTKSGRLPSDIPVAPHQVYKDWAGMGDWLGTWTIATRRRQYRSFGKARTFARSLSLKSGAEWLAFAKSGGLPGDIPTNPDNTYREKGWVGMGDWLGTGNVAATVKHRQFRSFEKARAFARSLDLKSGREWKSFTKSGRLPPDIPVNPNQAYGDDGWVSMGDWLGTGAVAPQLRQFRPFKAARTFARSLNLNSEAEWRRFRKSGRLPADIPTNPNTVYSKKGWAGMKDWLGTNAARDNDRSVAAPPMRQE
jgi:superfamily II DNA or RNA helicase